MTRPPNDALDAARYRWLRRRLLVRRLEQPVGDITVHMNRDYVYCGPQYISAEGFDAEMAVLDKSIDLAMKRAL